MKKVKYEKEILESFDHIGYIPRDKQVESVNKVLEAFIDNDYKNVVLSASTGTGKSVIGVVVAEAYSRLVEPTKLRYNSDSHETLTSLIMMHNNMLVKQYHESFEEKNDWESIYQIKGASNYKCGHLPDTATAEDCIKDSIFDFKNNKICNACEFNKSRKRKNKTNHLITNYSYFFTVTQIMDMDILSPRTISVWDEAHTIPDIFSMTYTIEVNEKLFEALESWFNKVGNQEFISGLKSIKRKVPNDTKRELIVNGKEEFDYKGIIKLFSLMINDVLVVAMQIAEDYLEQNNKDAYLQISPVIRGLQNKLMGFSTFVNNEYKHAFQWNDGEFGFTVKPIFIDKHIYKQYLDTSNKNLFMSGTVSKEFLVTTIGIEDDETCEIVLEPSFDPENKPFIFAKPITLNYKTLTEESTFKHLVNVIGTLIQHHSGEAGIILTPSFKMAGDLHKQLSGHNIILHEKGTSVESLLPLYAEQVEKAKDGNLEMPILISPSIFEGVNLPDDLCRFQILVKAPFPSLSEERAKIIMHEYPEIFNILTVMKMVQGAGRGVRSKNDWCVTYALDENIKRLFNSKSNIWKQEFTVEQF